MYRLAQNGYGIACDTGVRPTDYEDRFAAGLVRRWREVQLSDPRKLRGTDGISAWPLSQARRWAARTWYGGSGIAGMSFDQLYPADAKLAEVLNALYPLVRLHKAAR